MKKTIVGVLALTALVVSSCFVSTYADSLSGRSVGDASAADLEKVFTKQVNLILSHQDELVMTNEQLGRVKHLNNEVNKKILEFDDQLDMIAVDISEGIYQDPVEIEYMDVLADKKHELEKQRSSALIKGIAGLKTILTQDQKDELAQLLKKDDD